MPVSYTHLASVPGSGGGETVVAERAPTPEVAGSGGSSIGEPTVAEPVELSQASAVAPQAASVSTGASGGAGVTADAPIGAPSALKEGSLADVVLSLIHIWYMSRIQSRIDICQFLIIF